MNPGLWFAILLLPLAAACTSGPLVKAALDDEVRRLCAIDGGIKVYETVKLPADKFDRYGKLNFIIRSRGEAKSDDQYFYQWDIEYLRNENPLLSRSDYKIIRSIDGKLLGSSIRYSRGGGDMPGPWHDSSLICPPIAKEQPELETSIFIRKEN